MSGLHVGAHKTDDMVCEVGVEFAGIVLDTIGAVGTVGSSHDDLIVLGWCVEEQGWCRPSLLKKGANKSDDV